MMKIPAAWACRDVVSKTCESLRCPLSTGPKQRLEPVQLGGKIRSCHDGGRFESRARQRLELPGRDLADFGRKRLQNPEVYRHLNIATQACRDLTIVR